MKLQINHFSQYNSSIPATQQNKSCGICCVKMVLDFLFPKSKHPISNLLHEAVLIKAFDEHKNGGLWTHDGLVRILRNHGALVYPQEFKAVYVNLDQETFDDSENQEFYIQQGILKIKEKLNQGKPVIVSVMKDFNQNKDDHMIIISGHTANQEVDPKNPSKKSRNSFFHITDPQDKNLEKVSEKALLTYWKKLAIFVD